MPKVTNGRNQTFQHLLQPQYIIRIFLTSPNKPNCIIVHLYNFFFFFLLKSIKKIQLLELILTTRKNCDKRSYNKTNNNNQNLSPKNLRSAIQQTCQGRPHQVKHRILIRIINNSLTRQIPIHEIINPHQVKHKISIRTINNSLDKHIPIYQIITPN